MLLQHRWLAEPIPRGLGAPLTNIATAPALLPQVGPSFVSRTLFSLVLLTWLFTTENVYHGSPPPRPCCCRGVSPLGRP